MEDLAWPVNGPNAMDLTSMKRSLHMHRQWTDTYAQRAQQEAELYATTSCMAACKSMQEALTKFRAKCEFLEKAYAQLIAMDASAFERYNRENQEIIDLALKVNSKAGKAIKHVKTTAQANIQDADDAAQSRDKAVREHHGPVCRGHLRLLSTRAPTQGLSSDPRENSGTRGRQPQGGEGRAGHERPPRRTCQGCWQGRQQTEKSTDNSQSRSDVWKTTLQPLRKR